jgi:hypothetical protein
MTHDTIRERVAEAVLEDAGDEIDYLRLVAGADVAAREGDRLLREAVFNARRAGHSWDAIGRVLGVSRQAAQQRFRSPEAPEGRRVIKATAFNEVEILEREGREGNHLVDFGPMYLVVEPSEQEWEHLRVVGRREPEGDWELVGRWFPFRYYKRPR